MVLYECDECAAYSYLSRCTLYVKRLPPPLADFVVCTLFMFMFIYYSSLLYLLPVPVSNYNYDSPFFFVFVFCEQRNTNKNIIS